MFKAISPSRQSIGDTQAPGLITPHAALWPCIALCSIASFVVITICEHLLRPDLNVIHHQMSLYLIGPWGHLLQCAYVLLSLGMLALVYGLQASLPVRARSPIPLLLMIIAALALCVTAYAWMDMPGASVTLQGRIHHWVASTAFLFATFGAICQALALRHDAYWQRHLTWALSWALVCFLSLSLLLLCPKPLTGLGQKTVIVVILGWFFAVSACQLRRTRSMLTPKTHS